VTALSRRDLTGLLTDHGCPLDRWGQGPAKTLSHLLRELADGECRLTVQDGQLFRDVPGAMLRVRHRDLTLIEDHQRFTDGRESPVRRRQLPGSVGEKLQSGEDPDAGARRALAEELGITEPVALRGKHLTRKFAESESYPGLMSRFETWVYEVELPDSCYQPDGYREVQADKTTVWVWAPTADAPF